MTLAKIYVLEQIKPQQDKSAEFLSLKPSPADSLQTLVKHSHSCEMTKHSEKLSAMLLRSQIIFFSR